MSEFQIEIARIDNTFIIFLKTKDTTPSATLGFHHGLQSWQDMTISVGFSVLLAFLLLFAAPHQPLPTFKASSASQNFVLAECVSRIQVSRDGEATTSGFYTFVQNNADIVQGCKNSDALSTYGIFMARTFSRSLIG